MGENPRRHEQAGFTLIELIMTIVLIGIIGVGTVRFIGSTTDGVMDAADRQRIANIAWIVSEKVSREIRDALPNSVRTNTGSSCIEFIPTRAGSDYLAAPISPTTDSRFEVVPFIDYEAADVDTTVDRAAIYPSSTAALYSLPTSGAISGLLSTLSAGTTLNAVSIDLASAHGFAADSPNRRVYIVQDPIRFCFQSGQLVRFSDYGFQSSMATSILGSATSAVLASELNAGSFNFSPATLTRNGVVVMDFEVAGSSGATQPISQEVQLRNVP